MRKFSEGKEIVMRFIGLVVEEPDEEICGKPEEAAETLEVPAEEKPKKKTTKKK